MNQDAVLAVVELPPAAVVSERQHALLFFPSRRRPTSCLSDWSSDVCSSDLDSPSIAPLSTPPESAGLTSALEDVSAAPPVLDLRPDPAWNALDVLRLTILAIVALFVGVLTVLLIARFAIYPHSTLARLTGVPLVIVSGQALAYLLVLAYMYILVTRERHRPDFLAAIHWN